LLSVSPDQGQLASADSPCLRAAPEEEFLSSRHLKWIVTILLVYFGLRLLFFAATIPLFVPPDEVTHFGVCRIFSEVFFLPENLPETYAYGLVTNIPYLYYWIMGRLLTLNFFGISDLLFLRLLNIPLAFATIFFVWRMLRILTDDRLTHILLIAAMTNTLMFSFLSASVSYDNLTNLLAAMAVYYLLVFFRTRSSDLLAACFLCQLAGSLTKVTFLLLVMVLNIILLVHEFRNLRHLPASSISYFRHADWRRGVLAFGVLVGLALNIQLYGINYVRYGSLAPDMSKVLSPDKVMQHRTSARNRIFSLFKEGKVSYEDALGMASQISHPGDRAATIYLVQNYAALKDNGTELLGPLAYMAFWVQQMSAGIFGVAGHLPMLNFGPTIWLFYALFALTGIGLLLRWRPRDAEGIPACLMVIAAFYGFFLMYGVNYQDYLYYGSPVLGVSGRYIFPVLGPLYVLFSYYLMRLFRGGRTRLGISLAVSILFIASDLPYFLVHSTPDWFAPIFP
jgi:hypothetical protein